jgi:hypothetical protein
MTSRPADALEHEDDDALSTMDESATFAANDPVGSFTIPRLNGLPSIKIVRRALRQAVDHRMGVVVTGALGFGKSEGAHAAKERFADDQQKASHDHATHRRQRVYYVNLRTVRSQRQLTLDLLHKATPGLMARGRTRRNSTIDYDELREQLYRVYRAQNVVALIIDDAQRLTTAGLQFARDLIATKEMDAHRTIAGRDGSEAPAVGVGVVLIGTTELTKRVIDTGETHGNGRWVFEHTVGSIPEHSISRIYEHIFPAFAAHVSDVGRTAWESFIAQHVSLGRNLPIRVVTTHAREYFARLYDHSRGSVSDRDVAAFDRAIFLESLRATLWEPERFETPDTTEAARRAPDDASSSLR